MYIIGLLRLNIRQQNVNDDLFFSRNVNNKLNSEVKNENHAKVGLLYVPLRTESVSKQDWITKFTLSRWIMVLK